TTQYDDTSGAGRVTASARLNATASRSTTLRLDGFGRPYRSDLQGPQAKTIVSTIALDAAGRLAEEHAPFFDALDSPSTRTFYDALDRAVRVEEPGTAAGSPSVPGLRVTTVSYDRGLVTVTDANGNVRRRQLDPFGNAVRVEEDSETGVTATQYT